MRAIKLDPNEGAQAIDLEPGLDPLQAQVGGWIQALPVPDWRMENATDRHDVTAYVNEEGKFSCVDDEGRVIINRKATLFMLPNLFTGDFIAGPLILTGFNPNTGENQPLPEDVFEKFGLEVPA